MKKTLFILLLNALFLQHSYAHQPADSTKQVSKIVLIPVQEMMYFSDADRDIARYSRKEEGTVRQEIINNLDIQIYHQLLSHFDVIDLKRATSLNGAQDLKEIYAATRYSEYTLEQKKQYQEQLGIADNGEVQKLMKQFSLKSGSQLFWVSDSSTMLGAIQSKSVFEDLAKKYKEKYILFITQLELNTSNKNTIEWTKQQYERTYTIHYNLFDHQGKIMRAETLTVKGKNENTVSDINSLDLSLLAQKLKEILIAQDK